MGQLHNIALSLAFFGCTTSIYLGPTPDGAAVDAGAADVGTNIDSTVDVPIVDTGPRIVRPTDETSMEPPIPTPSRVLHLASARIDDTLLIAFYSQVSWNQPYGLFALRMNADGSLREGEMPLRLDFESVPSQPTVVAMDGRFVVVWLESTPNTPAYSFVPLRGLPTPRVAFGCPRDRDRYISEGTEHRRVSVATEGNRLVVATADSAPGALEGGLFPFQMCAREYLFNEDRNALSLVRSARLEHAGRVSALDLVWLDVVASASNEAVFFSAPGALMRWAPFGTEPPTIISPTPPHVGVSKIVRGASTHLLAWAHESVKALLLDENWWPIVEEPLEFGDVSFEWHADEGPFLDNAHPSVAFSNGEFLVGAPLDASRSSSGLGDWYLWSVSERGEVQPEDVPLYRLEAERHTEQNRIQGAFDVIDDGAGGTTFMLSHRPLSTVRMARRSAGGDFVHNEFLSTALAGTDASVSELAWLSCGERHCVSLFTRRGTDVPEEVFATVFRTADGAVVGTPAALLGRPEGSSGTRPCISNDGERFLVAWPESPPNLRTGRNDYRVRGLYFENGAWTATNDFIESTPMGFSREHPAVACAFVDERFYLADVGEHGDVRLFEEEEDAFEQVGAWAINVDEVDARAQSPITAASNGGALFVIDGTTTHLAAFHSQDLLVGDEFAPLHSLGANVRSDVTAWGDGYAFIMNPLEGAGALQAVLLDTGGATIATHQANSVSILNTRGRIAGTRHSTRGFISYERQPSGDSMETIIRTMESDGTLGRAVPFDGAIQDMVLLDDGGLVVLFRRASRSLPFLSELRVKILGSDLTLLR